MPTSNSRPAFFLAAALFFSTFSAHAGNEGSGGGNVLAVNLVSEEALGSAIKSLNVDLLYVFNQMELIMGDLVPREPNEQYPPLLEYEVFRQAGFAFPGGVEASVIRKLFYEGKETIFDILPLIKFTAQNSACIDRDDREADGSAFNEDPKVICLSIPRLTAKLRHDRYKAPLIALAAHEVTHKLGATEAEAIQLQAYLENILGENSVETVKEVHSPHFSVQIEAFSWILNALLEDISRAKKGKFNQRWIPALQKRWNIIAGTVENFANFSASPIRKKDNDRLAVIDVQLQLILDVLAPAEDLPPEATATAWSPFIAQPWSMHRLDIVVSEENAVESDVFEKRIDGVSFRSSESCMRANDRRTHSAKCISQILKGNVEGLLELVQRVRISSVKQ